VADKKISALTASSTPLAGTEVLPIVQSGATVKVSVADLTAGRSFDALGMTLTSTDAGVAAAPTLDLYRDSASPAASDTLGEIKFNGEDSAGNKQQYALIHAAIISPTSTSEGGQLHFETTTLGSSTEKMRIGTSGDVTLLTGNLVIGTAGKGVDFSIDPSAPGMTSELFDDYEEGTWTPSVGGTATYNAANNGSYTKVGNVVHCQFRLHITLIGTGSTSVISGLPFTSSASFYEQAGCVGLFEALATIMTFLTFFNSASATTLTLNGLALAAASTTAPAAVIGNNTVIFGSISYKV